MGARDKLGDLVQGTRDMLVLKTVARGAMHGYAIAEFIQATSNSVLRVEEGALYPALHRLELRGLLASEWGVSENNRRAKYYTAAHNSREITPRPDALFAGIPASCDVPVAMRGCISADWRRPELIDRGIGALEPYDLGHRADHGYRLGDRYVDVRRSRNALAGPALCGPHPGQMEPTLALRSE